MNFSKNAIINALRDQPKYRINQALDAIYRRGITDWHQITEYPLALRDRLSKEVPLDIIAISQKSSNENTIKATFDLGDAKIEAVLMRHRGRNTVCVSSQAGCACACAFCLTGQQGFKRNLTGDEISNQALFFRRLLITKGEDIDNIVVMGMGEPFNNYPELRRAILIWVSPEMFGLGARRISISTVGIIPGIQKLAREPWAVNLSLSLHAVDDKTRSRLMPINHKYPIEKTLKAIKNYIQSTGRRVMIEYLLLKDINDSPADAANLAKLLKQSLGRLFFVNLIHYNQTGKFKPSERANTAKFRQILEKANIETVERYRFGRDIKAACGQLAGQNI